MNRFTLFRKPDAILAVWLLLHIAAGWWYVAANRSISYFLYPGTLVLLGGSLYFLHKRWWYRTEQIRKYAILFGLVCFAGQLWDMTYSLPVVVFHMMLIISFATMYFMIELIWMTAVAYFVCILALPIGVSASYISESSMRIFIFIGLAFVFSMLVLCLIYLENLKNIRKLERDNNFERLGKQQHLATIGQIAASIAHDIRNPLTSIQGFVQLIERQERRAGYLEYYHIIRSEISRIDSLLREVLTLSKSHTMDQDSWKKVDLADLLQRLIMLMEPDCVRADVPIVLQLESAPIIFCSEDKIHQVFLNLIRNAIEAIGEHGQIDIVVTEEGEEAVVRIRDTGTGIPENKLDNLFTPFFTTKPEGTGLGLSICQSIVKAYGGAISVRNLPERGAEFTVMLPLFAKTGAITYHTA